MIYKKDLRDLGKYPGSFLIGSICREGAQLDKHTSLILLTGGGGT